MTKPEAMEATTDEKARIIDKLTEISRWQSLK